MLSSFYIDLSWNNFHSNSIQYGFLSFLKPIPKPKILFYTFELMTATLLGAIFNCIVKWPLSRLLAEVGLLIFCRWPSGSYWLPNPLTGKQYATCRIVMK